MSVSVSVARGNCIGKCGGIPLEGNNPLSGRSQTVVIGEVPQGGRRLAVLMIGHLTREKMIKWHAFFDDREPHLQSK